MLAALCLLGTLAPPTALPLLLAHYMPWYQSKAVGGTWGWHWTMNHFDPDRSESGLAQIASHYHPLIGAYDSSDPDVLECQCLLMKLTGIDGIVIDWYGTDAVDDFAQINRNAEQLAEAADRAGLSYAIMFEDSTVAELIRKRSISANQAIDHGRSVMAWLGEHWFKRSGYLRRRGQPVFLVFGPQYYKDEDFSALLAGLPYSPAYFRLLDRKGPAIGGFGWPGPQPGEARSWVELDAFYARAKTWLESVGVAYPRFDDIYAQAGVGASYGSIGDHGGETYRRTLDLALRSGSFAVQIATWNDWGEGTQIEPSVEFGYRDLEETQAAKRRLAGGDFTASATDLRLPTELYRLRKKHRGEVAKQRNLDRAADLLRAGRADAARNLLAP